MNSWQSQIYILNCIIFYIFIFKALNLFFYWYVYQNFNQLLHNFSLSALRQLYTPLKSHRQLSDGNIRPAWSFIRLGFIRSNILIHSIRTQISYPLFSKMTTLPQCRCFNENSKYFIQVFSVIDILYIIYIRYNRSMVSVMPSHFLFCAFKG